MPTPSRTTRRPTKPTLTIHVPLTPGICRWCRCTYENGCGIGCSWVDRAETLCSACEPLDRAMRTTAGRRSLADALQDHDFEALSGPTMSAAAAAARKRLLRRPRR